MKNCPMFSLCSNSIELRFRSVRRGNFLAYAGFKSNIEKSNVKNNPKNGFATLIKAFFARYARSRRLFLHLIDCFYDFDTEKTVFQRVETRILYVHS